MQHSVTELQTKRWRRYGNDRAYVSASAGERVGGPAALLRKPSLVSDECPAWCSGLDLRVLGGPGAVLGALEVGK